MKLNKLEKYYLEQLKKEGKEPVLYEMFGEELIHYYDIINSYKKLEFDDLMGLCTRYRLFVRVRSKDEVKKLLHIAKKANYNPSKYEEEIDSIPLKWLMVFFDKNAKTYSISNLTGAYTVARPSVVYFEDLIKYIGYMLEDYEK